MNRFGKLLTTSLGVGVLALGGLRLWDDHAFRRLETDLRTRNDSPSRVDTPPEELPSPARRYLRRAIPKHQPLASSAELGGRGAVQVNTLGLIPVVRSSGRDVTRSSRHRLAAESIWLPSVDGGIRKCMTVTMPPAR